MLVIGILCFALGFGLFLFATVSGRSLLKAVKNERPDLHKKYFSLFNRSYYYWGLIFGNSELEREDLPKELLASKKRVKRRYEASFIFFFLFVALLLLEVLITNASS